MHIEYGDFEVRFGSLTFLFRPTFQNMSNIGTPEDIISVLHCLYHSDSIAWFESYEKFLNRYSYMPITNHGITKQISNHSKNTAFKSACLVLQSCCDQDVSAMTGKISFGAKVYYQIGFESPDVIIELARHLMRHGVLGVSKKKSTNKASEPIREFNAAYHASVTINHLNFSRDEAWDMSMTEFIHHWEVANPDDEDKAQAQISLDKKKLNKCEEIRRKIREQRNG